MSVQTQIDRLEAAKEAISTAIAGKGVTVPDGTMLDGMAPLIESIEAGGGSCQVATGSFVPSSNNISSDPIQITGLPFKPVIVCIMYSDRTTISIGSSTYTSFAFVRCENYINSLHTYKTYVRSSLGLGDSDHYDNYFVITDDGFILSSDNVTPYSKIESKKYAYIAVG